MQPTLYPLLSETKIVLLVQIRDASRSMMPIRIAKKMHH